LVRVKISKGEISTALNNPATATGSVPLQNELRWKHTERQEEDGILIAEHASVQWKTDPMKQRFAHSGSSAEAI